MYGSKKMLFLTCETPLHAGTGSDLGIVDLPIQRERHTGFPKIEASGLKGSIKDAFRQLGESQKDKDGKKEFKQKVELVFGREPEPERDNKQEGDNKQDYISAIGMTDARLLLFPVRSMKGVFAWVTCPRVLQRFQAELALTDSKLSVDIPTTTNIVPKGTSLILQGKEDQVVLEEYTFAVKEDGQCTKLAEWLSEHIIADPSPNSYWHGKMRKDIVILSDDDFRHFVTLSTEVITRTRIDPEKGTVKDGGLFTEEFLPMESVMYTLVMATPVKHHKENGFDNAESVMDFFGDNVPDVVQIGGNATLGKGLVRTKLL